MGFTLWIKEELNGGDDWYVVVNPWYNSLDEWLEALRGDNRMFFIAWN